MDLTIKLIGLFLVAPHDERVYALIPETGTLTPPVDEHVAVLQIYNAYRDGDGNPQPDEYQYLDLENCDLLIVPAGGTPPTDPAGTKTKEIPQLNVLSGARLWPDMFDPKPTHVRGRVILTAGKKCGSRVGARFALDNKQERLCIELSWSMRMPNRRITLKRTNFRTGLEDDIDLESATDEMCLAVYHVPPAHLPPQHPPHTQPNVDDEAPHFRALYSLYDRPRIVIPRYKGDYGIGNGPDGNGCKKCGIDAEILGGDPVTCVGIGGGG